MAALSNKCEAIFAELPRIKQQLQSSIHGTDLFDIENGIEHFIANGIGIQITEAVRDSLATASENDEHAKGVKKIDQALTKCGKSIRGCRKHLDDAVKAEAATNKKELENKVSENWRDFAFGITHLSLLVPMKRIEVLVLLGGSGEASAQDPFPDSVSEAAVTRRSSALQSESQLPKVQHSSGPGSGFSIESFMRRARGQSQETTSKNTAAHARARSDFGPRKLTKKGQASAVAVEQSTVGSGPASSFSGRLSALPGVRASPSNRRTPVPPPAYSQITSLSFRDKKLLQEAKDDQKSTFSVQKSNVLQHPVQQSTARTPSLAPSSIPPRPAQHMESFTPQPPHTAQYIHTQNIYVANATWAPPLQSQWGPYLAPGFQPSPYQSFATPQPSFTPAPGMAPSLHQQPIAYKSSMWSLRQKLATEVFDLLKPDATCWHGIRHFKAHAACPCCMGNGCFG